MTRSYQPRERFEYRVRWRREHGKERQRTYGRLGAARNFAERVRGYESDDPLFPAEKLLYVHIDRRSVEDWEALPSEKSEHPDLADLYPENL